MKIIISRDVVFNESLMMIPRKQRQRKRPFFSKGIWVQHKYWSPRRKSHLDEAPSNISSGEDLLTSDLQINSDNVATSTTSPVQVQVTIADGLHKRNIKS